MTNERLLHSPFLWVAVTLMILAVALTVKNLRTEARDRTVAAEQAAVEREVAARPKPVLAITCPPDMVRGGDTCYPIVEDTDEGVSLVALRNQRKDGDGKVSTYEQIPRLPDRPESYDRYVYPLPPGLANGRSVSAGYDLDRPAAEQRHVSAKLIGHGGLDLPGARGAKVSLVSLDRQIGDAEVLYARALFGNTTVTRHRRSEGRGFQDYVVLYCHLDRIPAALTAGVMLREGEAVGTVGDTGTHAGATHLHLEVRRVRDGIDIREIARISPAGREILAETIVCDPRNVLSLRP